MPLTARTTPWISDPVGSAKRKSAVSEATFHDLRGTTDIRCFHHIKECHNGETEH
jgi:hypothetical protein